jgi:hypothetical protein
MVIAPLKNHGGAIFLIKMMRILLMKIANDLEISTGDIKRALSYENAYLAYIKDRLYDWAEWYSQCNFFGIGYSSRTIEHRLMVEGAIIGSTAPKSFLQNKEAEEIENYLHEMYLQEPETAIAMRWKYFFPNDSFRVLAAKLSAHGLNISHASVQMLLAKGHHWLEGRMTAKQKYNHLWVNGYVNKNLDEF